MGLFGGVLFVTFSRVKCENVTSIWVISSGPLEEVGIYINRFG